MTTDLIFIFIRVNIYPGPGDLEVISKQIYLIRVTIYSTALPHKIRRGRYLPLGAKGGG
jgi:hypothetical protein